MTDEERFYLERDRRTRECGVLDGFCRPVRVVVGRAAASSPAGQAMVLTFVNMLARIHRHLQLEIPRVNLLGPTIVPATRLDEAAYAVAQAINPYIRFNSVQASPHAIGLGDAPPGLPWYAGAERQIAIIGRQPLHVQPASTLSLGAALAACLAAATVLRQVLGHEQRPVRISAWNLREGDEAKPGPELPGPVDVGDVLMVGAGGVGSCLAFWLSEFGALGNWHILDRDEAILHNTNRCLGLLPHHAGWLGKSPRNKAVAAAELFGAVPHELWYDQFDHNTFKPDLILPLANERDVRHDVACRGEPVIMHATTSRTWEAQLHRHLAVSDDCITCRMPDPKKQVQLSCATVPLETTGTESTDAALPFLSATAALLLVSGLYRLQLGELASEPQNLLAVCFNDVRRHSRPGICTCRDGCTTTLPARVRRKLHAGHRWSHLDAAP